MMLPVGHLNYQVPDRRAAPAAESGDDADIAAATSQVAIILLQRGFLR
jgi:hypothetical protein